MPSPTKQVTNFFSKYPSKILAPEELLLSGHTQPQDVYYLVSGRIRQYTISATNGNILTVHVYHPGAYFPLMYALGRKPNHYFFDALVESKVNIAPAKAVEEFLTTHPEALYDLNLRLLAGLEGIANRLETVAFTDVYGRLLSQLLYLARHYGQVDEEGLTQVGRFTHQQLSEYMGVTREATSIAVKKLERMGLVVLRQHKLYVPSVERLAAEFDHHLQEGRPEPKK